MSLGTSAVDCLSSNNYSVGSSGSVASYGSVVSSMETLPTQDVTDGYEEEEPEQHEEIWGRLFPVGASFTALGRPMLCAVQSVRTVM